MEDIAKIVTKQDVATGRVREHVVEVRSFRKAAGRAVKTGNGDLRVPPPEVKRLLSASGNGDGSVWQVSLVEGREVDGRIMMRRAIDPASEEGRSLLRGIDVAEVLAAIRDREKQPSRTVITGAHRIRWHTTPPNQRPLRKGAIVRRSSPDGFSRTSTLRNGIAVSIRLTRTPQLKPPRL